MTRLLIAFIACLLFVAPAAAARHRAAAAEPQGQPAAPGPQDQPPAEARYLGYSGDVPRCDDAEALAWITRDFGDRESGYWGSSLEIDSFFEPRETNFRVNGASYIPRRYCRVTALFNDGARRAVAYEIGEGTGFLGIGYGVTWCVTGLDRNHAFSRNCKLNEP